MKKKYIDSYYVYLSVKSHFENFQILFGFFDFYNDRRGLHAGRGLRTVGWIVNYGRGDRSPDSLILPSWEHRGTHRKCEVKETHLLQKKLIIYIWICFHV